MVRQQLLLSVLTASTALVAPLPVYSKKNLDNPDKIGHRNVAHRSIIPPDKEIAIGKQYAAGFESSVELVQDPLVQLYVATVAENVVRNSDWKGSATVKLIKSPDVDGLSLPGGFIYLKSGLLVSAENEDAIAGAIAHQVAHAAARHWASDTTRQMIAQYSLLPPILISNITVCTSGSIPMACLGFLSFHQDSCSGPVGSLKSLRKEELEADYLGLQYMYKAGYAPSVYVAVLRRLASQPATSQSLPDSFQDMPPVSERIEQAEKEIRTILPNSPSPTKPSPQFMLMKSHL